MTPAERNRAIKKVLGKVFGNDKVRVRGETGTAYGWVSIYITVPKINCDCRQEGYTMGHRWDCEEFKKVSREVDKKVRQALEDSRLYDAIGNWTTDYGGELKEYNVIIKEEGE